MVAMLAFGGTFAYFTANANDVTGKKVTTGQIQLKNSDFTLVTSKVVSGMELLGTDQKIQVTSNDNVANFIFVTFTIDLGTLPEGTTVTLADVTGEDDAKLTENSVIGLKLAGKADALNSFSETDGQEGSVSGTKATLTYYIYESDKTAAAEVPYVIANSITLYAHAHSTEAKVSDLMNRELTFSVSAKSVQAFGSGDGSNTLANAREAYKKLHA